MSCITKHSHTRQKQNLGHTPRVHTPSYVLFCTFCHLQPPKQANLKTDGNENVTDHLRRNIKSLVHHVMKKATL